MQGAKPPAMLMLKGWWEGRRPLPAARSIDHRMGHVHWKYIRFL